MNLLQWKRGSSNYLLKLILCCFLSQQVYTTSTADKHDATSSSTGQLITTRSILLSPCVPSLLSSHDLLTTMPKTKALEIQLRIKFISPFMGGDSRDWIIEYLSVTNLIGYLQLSSSSLEEIYTKIDDISTQATPRKRRRSGASRLSPRMSPMPTLRSMGMFSDGTEDMIVPLSPNQCAQTMMEQLFASKYPGRTENILIHFLTNVCIYKKVKPLSFFGGWAILVRYKLKTLPIPTADPGAATDPGAAIEDPLGAATEDSPPVPVDVPVAKGEISQEDYTTKTLRLSAVLELPLTELSKGDVDIEQTDPIELLEGGADTGQTESIELSEGGADTGQPHSGSDTT